MTSPAAYFDSELVARLSRLELTAQRIVDGFLAGRNRSLRHGFSVEFTEHREYVPGDDLRHLDWKVLGRLDRYYIKRYEAETNITAVLLLDTSASMAYASDGLSKLELGAAAASALGHLLQRQRDAVGLGLFDDDLREYRPPSARRTSFAHLVARLHGARPQSTTALDAVLRRLGRELPGRCLFVVASDLFLPLEDLESALERLHYEGHDAVMLQTLAGAERTFPFRENLLFQGLEDERRLLAEPQRLRRRYLRALEEHLAAVEDACRKRGFDYRLLRTDEPLATGLTSLLAARARRRRSHRRARGG